jgi:integrase
VDFRDQHGRRHFKFYDTRREADDYLSTIIKDVKAERYRSPEELPDFAAVAARWLEGKRDHPASTFAYLQNHVENHLVKEFGPLRIDRVTPERVEDFKNATWKSGQGLARSTTNKILQTLGTILDYALVHQYVTRNTARLVKRVRRERKAGQAGATAVDPKDVLTAEQAGRLIAAAEPGLFRMFIQMAVLTGARSGELHALAWDAIDFDRRRFRIERSLSWKRTKGAGYGKSEPVFGPPKTDSSYRTLDLAPELVHALKAWKLKAPPSALVFPNQTGGPLHHAYIYKGLKKALEACPDLPRVDVHALRHSFASIALGQLQLPVTQVSKLLGHKDASITLDAYAHWFEELSSEGAMADMATTILNPRGDQMVTSAVGDAVTS